LVAEDIAKAVYPRDDLKLLLGEVRVLEDHVGKSLTFTCGVR
jgi:hypothetical protein